VTGKLKIILKEPDSEIKTNQEVKTKKSEQQVPITFSSC
jgi:hypothetical protein